MDPYQIALYQNPAFPLFGIPNLTFLFVCFVLMCMGKMPNYRHRNTLIF